jgi:hypothetical protein
MTEYSGIRGTRVKYLSSDPTLNTSTEGQVWYNSTTGNLRVQGVGVSAWSSGGNLITARRALGGAGTQTAGLGFSGYVTPACGYYRRIQWKWLGYGWKHGNR